MRLVGVAACALMTGCAGLPEPLQPLSSWFWNTFNKFRTPGPQQVDPLQKVSAEFDCPNRPQPWVLLETHQLWPGRLAPEDELNERFVYVLCPAPGQGEVRGTLTRRVLTGRTVIWGPQVSDYDLKPGRWSVDAFLTIPGQAPAGPYEFEVSFETNKLVFRDNKSFTVVKP
jgi:hypothetical protein